MVKILLNDVSEDNYTYAHFENTRLLMGIKLLFGEPLLGRFPDGIRVLVEPDSQPSDYFYVGPMLVISERFKQILDSFQANVEYFNVEVALADGSQPTQPYFYPNLLDVVDCFDWQKSKYTPGKHCFALDLEVVVLRETETTQSPLFLVARTIPRLICVRGDVAEVLQESGCRGFVLRTPAEWRNPKYPYSTY